MSSLVSDIVEITRVEGDPFSQKTESLDVNRLVAAIVEDSHIEAETRVCRLEIIGHVTREIEGNQELLRRAIENVVRNAIHYSPANSVVSVLLESRPGAATIQVRNRGPGVPEESLTRIFEPYFRVEEAREKPSSPRREIGGAGKPYNR